MSFGIGLIHLHSLLRWVILVLLLVSLYQASVRSEKIKATGLWLMIVSHVMFLIGLFQWYSKFQGVTDFKVAMGVKETRFFILEHPLMMLLSIVLITLSYRKAKAMNHKAVLILLGIALLLILFAIPWPFLEAWQNKSWFPGM